MGDERGNPELRVLSVDSIGRSWSESAVPGNQPFRNVWGLYPSPDGKYLAVEDASTGEGESLTVYILERASGEIWCPLAEPASCRGTFGGWVSNERFLFHPLDVPPKGIALGSVITVDVAGRYSQLELPPDTNFSLIHQISLNSDGSKLAYSIAYWENKEEISEIWIMQIDGQNKQRLLKMNGTIQALEWSPADSQLLYLYQPNDRNASSDPADLKLLNVDTGGERLLASNIRMAGERRYRPIWSPDGRYIAFLQVDDATQFLNDWREPGVNAYVADAITGQLTRLSSFNGRNASFATWSPDSKYIAFVSSSISGDPREEVNPAYAEVWTAKVDSSQLRPISNSAKWRNALAWLPSIVAK